MSFFGIPIRNSLAIGLGSLVPLSSRPSPLVSALALNLNFLTPTLDPRITFTRADATTCATRVNASGVIETVAANIPRFDYDPITLACKGLLIEESRANLLYPSNDFRNTAEAGATRLWYNVATPITTDSTLSPDGTANASLTVADSTSALHGRRFGVTATTNTTFTYTVYAKQGPGSNEFVIAYGVGTSVGAWNSGIRGNARFNLTTGALVSSGVAGTSAIVGTPTATNVGNGWYRCELSFTPDTTGGATGFTIGHVSIPATSFPVFAWSGDDVSGAYVWGAQLEVGTFPTSYIPTATVAVTRAADSALVDGTNFSSWFNQSEGTFVCGAVNQFVTGVASKTWLQVSDAGVANRYTGFIGTTGKPQLFMSSGGVTQINGIGVTLATLVANTPFKTAFAYKVNDFAISADGQTSVTDTLGALPIAVDRMRIGGVSTTNTPFNGHIRQVSYYNTRLTNAQLQAVST